MFWGYIPGWAGTTKWIPFVRCAYSASRWPPPKAVDTDIAILMSSFSRVTYA